MQGTLAKGKTAVGMLRLLVVGTLTIAATVTVNVVARALAFAIWPISPVFLPLQVAPLAIVTAVLVGGGVLVYALVGRFAERPVRTFTIIALVALLLSLVPHALLVVNPDPSTFPGVSRQAVGLLIALHVADATIVVVLLSRLAPSHGRGTRS